MQTYITIIQYGILFFPLFFVIVTLPFLVQSYFKYGSVTLKRGIIMYSFFFYLFMVFAFVILPLPDADVVAKLRGPKMQLQPFYFVWLFVNKSIFRWSDFSTYVPAMLQGYFFQPIFNVLLFMPLGVYLRYYFKQKWFAILLFSLTFSLLLEVTQLTGLFGVYVRPYRLFDVDDLMLNIVGGMIGFLLSPVLTKWLPSKEELLEKSYIKGQKVGYTRRFLAMIIDVFSLVMGITIFSYYFPVGTIPLSVVDINSATDALIYLAIIISYFALLPGLTKGRTFGKWAVQIAIISRDGSDANLFQLIIRCLLLYGGCAMVLGSMALIFLNQEILGTVGLKGLIILVVVVLLALVFLVDVVIQFWRQEKLLFYERLSGTMEVSTVGEQNK
ncbi:MAG: VanZ family protein [Culicoidibacterales bacterium]